MLNLKFRLGKTFSYNIFVTSAIFYSLTSRGFILIDLWYVLLYKLIIEDRISLYLYLLRNN